MLTRKPIVLKNDLELLDVMKEMKFERVQPELYVTEEIAMLVLIRQFLDNYENTDQDTVEFAPEFVVVVRRIFQGYRPTKLVYLTDFEGEIKE